MSISLLFRIPAQLVRLSLREQSASWRGYDITRKYRNTYSDDLKIGEKVLKSKKPFDNDFLEIATALEGGTFTIFAGTGFSMHLTNGNAPTWLELLYECAKHLEEPDILNGLFNFDDNSDYPSDSKFDLTVCAQILEDEFVSFGEDIRVEICKIIRNRINEDSIDVDIVEELKEFFENHKDVNIVTTNYDTLFSSFLMPHHARVYVEGSTIPKISGIKNIYHIHGSVEVPESIILTQDDYFRFQHRETYISRKFYTLLQETTCVILGYSLGDFDLNRILNESKYSRQSSGKKNDIYYISRTHVDDIVKKYYFSTFGIRVIDGYEIIEFFQELGKWTQEARSIIRGAERLPKILDGTKQYKDDFLKIRRTFGTILVRLMVAGYSLNDNDVLNFLLDLLEKKKSFSRETDAWDQYTHLASWLIQLGSLVNLRNTPVAELYLELVDYSFENMSEKLTIGYAWAAFQVWKREWDSILEDNKALIREMVEDTHYSKIHGVTGIVG